MKMKMKMNKLALIGGELGLQFTRDVVSRSSRAMCKTQGASISIRKEYTRVICKGRAVMCLKKKEKSISIRDPQRRLGLLLKREVVIKRLNAGALSLSLGRRRQEKEKGIEANEGSAGMNQ